MRRTLALSTASAALFVLTWPVADAHANDWKKTESRCKDLFKEPTKASITELGTCADTWTTYADVRDLSQAERIQFERAFRHLYDKGDTTMSMVGRSALERLGIAVPVRKAGQAHTTAKAGADAKAKPAGTDANAAPARKKYDPPEASGPKKKEAKKLAEEGIKLNKAKKWTQGAMKLEDAVEKDPRSELAMYNLACTYAQQEDKKEQAFEQLQHLADLDTEVSLDYVRKARVDKDFEPIREEGEFKRITGYARIKLVNSLGGVGKEAVEKIEKLLLKMDHKVAYKADRKDEEKSPLVRFKPHAKAQAGVIAEVLDHPKTRLDAAPESSDFDIEIIWGAEVKRDEKGAAVSVDSRGPEVVDDKVQDARRKQNKALASPDKAIQDVDRTMSTPDRTIQAGKDSAGRAKQTLDKTKKLYEKIKSPTIKGL